MSREELSRERSCLSYIHSRQGGNEMFDMAWEWTVYFDKAFGDAP